MNISDQITALVNPEPVFADPEHEPDFAQHYQWIAERDESDVSRRYGGERVDRSALFADRDSSHGDSSASSRASTPNSERLELYAESGLADAPIARSEQLDDEDSVGEDCARQFAAIEVRADDDELAKALAVRDQTRVFEKLIECRIRAQKVLLDCNRLPLERRDDTRQAVADAAQHVTDLFDALAHIDRAVGAQWPTETVGGEARDALLRARHDRLAAVSGATLDKWFEKTRFGPRSRSAMAGLEERPTAQMTRILADRQRLVRRTQLKRSLYSRVGAAVATAEDEWDAEVFDDDDFYHQLLRELIATKGESESSRKWLSIQRQRSKMKRKVDTKASKGRKVRYEVHPKLVNFMAPIDHTSYSEAAKQQLFGSLFGNAHHL